MNIKIISTSMKLKIHGRELEFVIPSNKSGLKFPSKEDIEKMLNNRVQLVNKEENNITFNHEEFYHDLWILTHVLNGGERIDGGRMLLQVIETTPYKNPLNTEIVKFVNYCISVLLPNSNERINSDYGFDTENDDARYKLSLRVYEYDFKKDFKILFLGMGLMDGFDFKSIIDKHTKDVFINYEELEKELYNESFRYLADNIDSYKSLDVYSVRNTEPHRNLFYPSILEIIDSLKKLNPKAIDRDFIHRSVFYAWFPLKASGDWTWLTNVIRIEDKRPILFQGLTSTVYYEKI
ncbi:hypothetical protein BPT24_071 [Tenacibaculum phage pT24]|uniref:Uncharacterized protein n=1 Tax=Tenacibaculum phage pT24 TaxID=1880590 RepID=A0A1B4XWM8_9CAUD|nr:hypothetical protein HYP10_gp071 [Tenacibaculum phage pT24]BAV39194.1 hypothetical protein BPT24_071 [Tenacibaculum phage pT24]